MVTENANGAWDSGHRPVGQTWGKEPLICAIMRTCGAAQRGWDLFMGICEHGVGAMVINLPEYGLPMQSPDLSKLKGGGEGG